MEIFNTTTKETVEVIVTDIFTGVDWFQDATGDTDDFVWNEEEDRYEADSDTIEWWIDFNNDCEDAYEKFSNIPSEKEQEVRDYYNDTYTEFNNQAMILINAIDKVCGE